MEESNLIVAGWDVGDGVLAVPRADREPGRVQHRDYRAHGGVDVAKDTHDSGVPERDTTRGLRRVEADIEGLPAEIGKRVVENGVLVRQIDSAANGNGEDVRE